MRLDEVRGFVFDVDGTLVHRSGAEVRALPGARDALEAIRASGRPFALFTKQFGVGLGAARRDPPVDVAWIVARLVRPGFVELHAATAKM